VNNRLCPSKSPPRGRLCKTSSPSPHGERAGVRADTISKNIIHLPYTFPSRERLGEGR